MAAPVKIWDLGDEAELLPVIEKARIWLVASANYGKAVALLNNEPCQYCGADASTFDHVVPRSKGGPDTEDNLVPTCRICNGDKKAFTPTEWAEVCRLRLEALKQITAGGHLDAAALELQRKRANERVERERQRDIEVELFLETQGVAEDASAEHAWRLTKYVAIEQGYRAGQVKEAQGRRRTKKGQVS